MWMCLGLGHRVPTWEWLAIIRHAVTRGYVRQLELCFLTETWFVLLVVTVATSKGDRKQTQTKGQRNQCWLNTAILLIPSACKQTSGYQLWRLMLIPKSSGVTEPVHLYWWCLQGVVEAAGAVRGWQHWAHFAMFTVTSLVFCRRLRELWAELALLLYFLSYSCWERLEPKQLLAPLQLTLL